MSEQEGAVIGINLGNTYGSIACVNQQYVRRCGGWAEWLTCAADAPMSL